MIKKEMQILENAISENTEYVEIIGIVENCMKLNVRKKPSKQAEVVYVISFGDTVIINEEKSNKAWFAITTTSGIQGYCMRKFIAKKKRG